MPVIAFNSSTRTHTHTHVPFLYLPRLICPSTVYLSLCVCVCLRAHNTPPYFLSNTLSISFSSKNPLPFRGRVLQLLFFDVDCRRCCVYALSLHMYVCGNDNTPTQQTHTAHTEHTLQTHTTHSHSELRTEMDELKSCLMTSNNQRTVNQQQKNKGLLSNL